VTAANLSTEAAVLKTIYPTLVDVEWFEHMALAAMAVKKTDFFGANYVQAFRWTTGQGRSRKFANAQANKGPASTSKFTVTRGRDYSVFSIDGETIDAASNDRGAIVDEVTLQVDGAMDAINQSTARALYRNTVGVMGQISSGSTTATITLVDANTSIFFQNGNNAGACSSNAITATLRSGSCIVGVVDYVLGTIATANGLAWNDPTNIGAGLGASDYLLPDVGDFLQGLAGLDGWCPSTSPTVGDAWFGLDRSKDPVHMAGVRAINTSGAAPEEAIQKALQQGFRYGGRYDRVYTNDADFENLTLSLGSRVVYTTVPTDVEIGFEGVKIQSIYGPVTVHPDPNCQQGTFWGVMSSKFIWRTLREYPRFLDADKLGRFLREPSSDSYEGRIGGYGNPMTSYPVGILRGSY
jgi:hypothetical protein